MSDLTSTESKQRINDSQQSFFNKHKAHLVWFILIGAYLYVTLLPEVIFVNGSGQRVEQVKILIPNDDKVWRNIEHGGSKAFRYVPTMKGGEYLVSVILSDGTLIKTNFPGIKPWNMGHKAIIELTPDMKLSADFTYSLF